ncbi:MAG: hypothetical protein ACR2PX_15265 [Endozoicomonas sp.]|uniref:ATP-binding protein n=1 Tax=Endozoicomonas sp. TaxID=1892382 RepID=UPI003D9BD9D6
MYDTTGKELLVVKDTALGSPDKGTVKIVFTRSIHDGVIGLPDEKEFPTGGVWISKGYEDIDQKFKDGELFLLEGFSYLDDRDLQGGSQKHHSHWSTGHAAKPLETNQMIPVINSSLPDKSTGLWDFLGTPPQGAFFILSENNVYGPFTADVVDDEVTVAPSSQMALGLPTHHIAMINLDELQNQGVFIKHGLSSEAQVTAGYVPSIKILSQKLNQKITQIDYITDTQLITFFSKNKFGKSSPSISRKAAETLKKTIGDILRREKQAKNNERINRLKKLLDQYLEGSDAGEVIVDNYLRSSAGKEFLTSYIKENPSMANNYLPELSSKKEALEMDIRDLSAKKLKKEQEAELSITEAKEKAEEEIKRIKEKSDDELKKERNKFMGNLEKDIQDKQKELEDLSTKRSEMLDDIDLLDKAHELNDKVKFLEWREIGLRDTVKAQEAKLKSPDLPKEMTEIKTILDLLQGHSYNRENNKVNYLPAKIMGNLPDAGSSLIQAFVEKFDDRGREFSFEEMANIIITTQQSFLTVFKGLPGAGKTSTAIRLAKAHGLLENENDTSNFLNIPVSRGWVSGRDFIGFYNSLKGIYQPSKTGLYQFLQHSKEKGVNNSLRMVLLDEANLSPIEHYWSDFLAMCDGEGRNRLIDTGMHGEERYLTSGNNLRFIATINNDHTTEPLSPRLCDRVPVISMDIPQLSSQTEGDSFSLSGAVPYEQLETFFGLPNEMLEDEPLVLTSFYDILEKKDKNFGNPVTVSKRKRNAMSAYYEVACRYMDRKYAADFAISQHALPLINGYGKQFKDRLEKLRDHAAQNNLSRTSELLEGILIDGDAYVGSYNFF